jgi:hypothetical protein
MTLKRKLHFGRCESQTADHFLPARLIRLPCSARVGQDHFTAESPALAPLAVIRAAALIDCPVVKLCGVTASAAPRDYGRLLIPNKPLM